MSHFSILVIGNDVEKQLAPYHEFECTGKLDEFVIDHDVTAEAREEYAKDTSRRYKDPEGNLHDPYADRFYRELTHEEIAKHGPFLGSGIGNGLSWYSKDWGDGLGYRAKVHQLPEGWEEVELPTPEVESFSEWAQGYYGRELWTGEGDPPRTDDRDNPHKYGFIHVDGNGQVLRIVQRTNKNKKWDWWQVGGRFTGHLKLKPSAGGIVGKPGLLTSLPEPGHVDSCMKGDVDFEGLRNDAGKEAATRWDRARALLGDTLDTFIPWERMREEIHKGDHQAASNAYNEQPAVQAFRAHREEFLWHNVEDFLISKEAYVENARNKAICTFAVVKDGQWYERGEMGWWACVSNEKPKGEWECEFSAMVDALPDDTPLTVVDAHI